MSLMILSFLLAFVSCATISVDWKQIDIRRKKNDPSLSAWLEWNQLSSIPEAEVFFRLLVKRNAMSLPPSERRRVLRIRVSFVTFILAIVLWLAGYYRDTGSLL